MADAAGVVDRFLDLLSGDPETGAMAAMVVPYKAMATPEQIVETLDKLARMWAAAKQPGVPA